MAMYTPIQTLNQNDMYQGLVDQLNLQKKMQQQQYLEEMKNAQRAKEAAENAKYHQGMLGVSQSAEARAQKLLPYQTQQYQTNIAKAKQEQSIMNDLLNGGTNGTSGTNMSGVGGGEAQSPFLGGGGPADAQMQAQNMPPELQQFMQQKTQQPSIENLQMGQRMTVRPPQDERKAKWDRLAGMKIGNIHIPAVETRVENGVEYKTYPSGMQIATKVAPSEMEKEGIKIDAKASSEIRKSARDLKSMHDRALKLRNMLEKNPNLTGLIQGAKASTNLSQDKDLAEFIQTTRKLQADMGRYGSQRGGAQALKWAEKSKPGEFRSGKFNLGMIQSILDDAESDYQNLNTEYTDMNKRPLSVKLQPSKKDESNDVVNLNGKQYKFTNGEWHEVMGGS